MEFLLDSHKKKQVLCKRLQIMTWSAGPFSFPFFLLQQRQAPCRLKKTLFFSVAFHFVVAFHLLKVVLAFTQNKAFERIIIILPYPL